MGRWSVILGILPVLVSGCTIVEGSGFEGSRTQALTSFSEVVNETQIPVDVHIDPDASPSADVRCDTNLLDHILLQVIDGRLEITVEERVLLRPETDCLIQVSGAELTAATLRGSGDLRLSGALPAIASLSLQGSGDLNVGPAGSTALQVAIQGSGDVSIASLEEAENVSVDIGGSGDLEVAALTSPSLRMEIRGSGDAHIEGTAAGVTLDILGSGDAELSALRSRSADIDVTGSGRSWVHASDAVRVRGAGSGDVTVTGAPAERDVARTGSGRVTFE